MLGFPFMRLSGPETTAGQAFHYLAELPWMPRVIHGNDQLEWRQLDERSVEVAATIERPATRRHVRLRRRGRHHSRNNRDQAVRHRRKLQADTLGRQFHNYQSFNGIRMPASADVYWGLPEGRFVYWSGTVTSAVALEQPLPPATDEIAGVAEDVQSLMKTKPTATGHVGAAGISLDVVASTLRRLRDEIRLTAGADGPGGLDPSVANMRAYLALRAHDNRELQRALARLGLSSLGRSEAHVLATLEQVLDDRGAARGGRCLDGASR